MTVWFECSVTVTHTHMKWLSTYVNSAADTRNSHLYILYSNHISKCSNCPFIFHEYLHSFSHSFLNKFSTSLDELFYIHRPGFIFLTFALKYQSYQVFSSGELGSLLQPWSLS